MEGDGDPVEAERLAIPDSPDPGGGPEPRPQHPDAELRGQISPRSPARVIAVGVGSDRPVYRLPRIHVEVARLAVETAVGEGEKRHD
jgi:hypothetical protein